MLRQPNSVQMWLTRCIDLTVSLATVKTLLEQTRPHNVMLWLDYTDEAASYHTPDMSMWGSVKYRRTVLFSLSQSITRRHRLRSIRPQFQSNRTTASSPTSGMILRQLVDLANWLCDSFADHIAPQSFVVLSYMDVWALAATCENSAAPSSQEATLKPLRNSRSMPNSLLKQNLPR